MHLSINGQDRNFEELAAGATVAELVVALGIQADRIAIEHNHEIVPRTSWAASPVSEGDRLEIVHFVGGGAC